MDERTEELASLHALDLLEGAELAAFESELAKDPGLRRLVDGLRDAANQLAMTASASAPSPQLRARVMASVAKLPSRGAASTLPSRAPGRVVPFASPSWLGWAAAACFALVAAWLGQRSLSMDRELATARALAEIEPNLQTVRQQLDAERLIAQQQVNDLKKAQQDAATLGNSLTQERSQAAHRLADLQAKYDLANFKVARLAALAGNSPEAAAIAVWNPSTQQGVLTVQKMPALATGQDYQFWVIDPQYVDPVDGGVFTVDPATGEGRMVFRPKQPIANAAKFAISRERKGGVAKPTMTAIVLMGQ